MSSDGCSSFPVSNNRCEKNMNNFDHLSDEQQTDSPKRRWSLGRLHLTNDNGKSSYLERRMTLPLLNTRKNRNPRCELTTPVKNRGNRHDFPDHVKMNNIFTFWKTEDDFGDLLEKIDASSASEVSKVCEVVNLKLQAKDISTTELAEFVQNIYKLVDLKIRRKVFDNEITVNNAKKTLIKFEDRLMKGLHENAFKKVLLEESENDRRLSSIIDDLSWVTPHHLSAKIDDSDKKLSEKFDQAMLDVATINFKESPIAKLKCIMNCSRRIFEILKARPDSSETADDFLSILVFVVLQANPARLHSNIRYIHQFGNSDQIMKGEEGYYFTHLCSVVSFIENLSARSLDLSEEEFRLLNSTNSSELEENSTGLRMRRISCSRQMSLCICKIYHRAVEGPPLQLDMDNLWKKSVTIHEQVLVVEAT